MYIDLSDLNSGFCDRLRQITFCIAYEKLKKNKVKKIEIFERKNKECPFYFTDLLSIHKYKVINIKKKNKKIKSLKMSPYNSNISIETCKIFNQSININNEKLLKEWKKTYKLLKPKKKFIPKINKFLKHKNLICIHSRITDKLTSYFDSFFEIPNKDIIYKRQIFEFCNNLNKLIKKNTKNIYIASDEGFYRNRIINSLDKKFKIINKSQNFKKAKLRQTSGEDFVVDLFVMSNSKSIISTTGGNVPLTALLISAKRKKFIKWTTVKLNYRISFFIRCLIFYLRNFKF